MSFKDGKAIIFENIWRFALVTDYLQSILMAFSPQKQIENLLYRSLRVAWSERHPNKLLKTESNSTASLKVGWLVVLRLNVPVNNFSVMSGRSHRFLGN